MRKERAESIKTDFQNNVPEIVTIHWDGKLLPGLNVTGSKEERLPILISFGEKDQLLAVPKLDSSTGKDQAEAVLNALSDWDLNDKVQIMYCDTTASNTGRLNGACVILDQKLERELLLFACCHHMYELVLKCVFESKIHQVTSSSDISLLKKIRDNWKNDNATATETCNDFVKKYFCETMINELINYYKKELLKSIIRDDYRELIELCIAFLGGDNEKKFKIRPPGTMHQARWMARAIYSLKICLLQSQFKMSAEDKRALQDVCLFIAMAYVKPWLECNLTVKAPNQDLCFIKTLKNYETVDQVISKAALPKFSQHLWYLSEEIVLFSLFDDEVDAQTKADIISNLQRESLYDFGKRYIPSKDEISASLYGTRLSDFVTIKGTNLLSPLKIDNAFLQEDVSSWEQIPFFEEAKKNVMHLKAVNDTVERGVKLMQDFHGLITAAEEQKQFLLRCVQEHRKLYPDCKKDTLKKKYPES